MKRPRDPLRESGARWRQRLTHPSVLAPWRRLYLDTGGIVLGARGRMFGRDALAKQGALAEASRCLPGGLAAVGPGLRAGLCTGEGPPKAAALHHQPLRSE